MNCRFRSFFACVNAAAALLAFTLCAGAAPVAAPIVERPPEKRNPPPAVRELRHDVDDPGVVTTRQNVTPAGVAAVFNGKVYDAVFGETDDDVWVLVGRPNTLHRLRWSANRLELTRKLPGRPALQGLVWDESAGRLIVARNSRIPADAAKAAPDDEQIDIVAVGRGDVESKLADGLGFAEAGAPAIAANRDASGRRPLLLPLTRDDRVAILDAETGRVEGTIETGIAPFAAVVDSAGTVAYVSNWGGRFSEPGELTAPRGLKEDADRVVIDDRGVASTGTVSRIDVSRRVVTDRIAVGLHPSALAWDETNARLYVANGNSDTVSVIDTRRDRVVKKFRLQPFERAIDGVAPTALALTGDGRTLFVACGGINAVLVVDTARGRIRGALPTAWYPDALSLSRDGRRLLVSTLLGVGSGGEENHPEWRYVHSYRGTVHLIDLDEALAADHLAAYSRAVAVNNRMEDDDDADPRLKPRRGIPARAIPERPGEPSPIEHVVYIIKENRTYDQVLGDLGRGNGDPNLTIYGRHITPNHHRLAEQFVTLDNFFATGGNSGDGHQWLTQANETDYALLPGYEGRSYPFDGTDPVAVASRGFLWDEALARGRTVRVYGEYAPRMTESKQNRMQFLQRWKAGDDFANDFNASSPMPALDRILARHYPTYTQAVPDVVRASIFLRDLKGWEKAGTMPNLVIVQLPCDHTRGTTPGGSTPPAMVADNDYSLGRIVAGLSASPFWPKMAIFVVEDDAQAGVDHVDGHRTVALVASPYARRGHVDSTFYSHTSMVRTIELILGLRPLSLFDQIATDMRAAFQDKPDLTTYTAADAEVSLFAVNPSLTALSGPARAAAEDSGKMRWDVPDAVPSERLNRILWHDARGWETPYPGVRVAAFAPLSLDLDDDERE